MLTLLSLGLDDRLHWLDNTLIRHVETNRRKNVLSGWNRLRRISFAHAICFEDYACRSALPDKYEDATDFPDLNGPPQATNTTRPSPRLWQS